MNTLPVSFLLDQNGRIIERYSGYRSGDEKEIRDAALELLQKL